jgi:hypothetical protein
MKTPDEIREFDEMQVEIRHQADLTHRAHPEGIEEGRKVGCPICFEDYIDLGLQ